MCLVIGSFFLGYCSNKSKDVINEVPEISNINQKVNFGNLIYYIPDEYSYLIDSNKLQIKNSNISMLFQSSNINYETFKLRKDEFKSNFDKSYNTNFVVEENYNNTEGLYFEGKYNNYLISIIIYPLTRYHVILSLAMSEDNDYDSLVAKQIDILNDIAINKNIELNDNTFDLLSIVEEVLDDEQ